MVRQADLVLAAIPALAIGGVVLERVAPLIAVAPAVSGTVTRLPLAVLGLVAAAAVVLYALFGWPGPQPG